MTMVVRAIDLGFGNTKFITASVDGKIECSHFPSLAVLAPGEKGVVDLVGKRKTVCVPVRGVWYEVGYDVEQAASAFKARPRHERYIETAEYMALTAGAQLGGEAAGGGPRRVIALHVLTLVEQDIDQGRLQLLRALQATLQGRVAQLLISVHALLLQGLLCTMMQHGKEPSSGT